MPAVVARRRTRYDVPAWAEGFDLSSPAGFDAMAAHGEARKLPRDLDPNDIDDDDVRDAYLQQLQEEHEASTSSAGSGAQDSSAGGAGTRGARDGTGSPTSPPARLGAAVRRDAGGAFGSIDIDDGAGLLLGLIAYAVAVAAFRDPVSATNGVKRWFAAKFLNKTSTTGNLTASAADPQVTGLSLLTAPLTASNATPAQPPAPANIGDILRAGLPPSAFTAPRPPPPAGTS